MPGEQTLAAPRTRFVIVHYHIFKNAGTTIESILRREFGNGFATLHGPSSDSVLDAKDLTKFLNQNAEISAVSSHHLRYPKPAPRRTVIFDCCFLRHPLDRLVSLYTYSRKIEAAQQTQREFITEMMRDFPNMVSNVHVTQLANAGAFSRPANERDLERATQIFCDMALPGLVEMFNESLVAAEYFLKPAFPKLRLDQWPQNVSRANDYPDRLQKLEDTLVDLWGSDLYNDLVRLNQLDLELYRRAQSEIRRRLFLVPGLDEKLRDFNARCVLHRTPDGRAMAANRS